MNHFCPPICTNANQAESNQAAVAAVTPLPQTPSSAATAITPAAIASTNNNTSTNIWDNDVLENDDFDSDQLDEDESYSWASGITDNQDNMQTANGSHAASGLASNNLATCGNSSAANWRDWRSNILAQGVKTAAIAPKLVSLNSTCATAATTRYIVTCGPIFYDA